MALFHGLKTCQHYYDSVQSRACHTAPGWLMRQWCAMEGASAPSAEPTKWLCVASQIPTTKCEGMEIITNLRITLRRLIKHRGYASAAVLILALAIGATGGVFSAVYAILLRPLPLDNPERLVVCWETDPARGVGVVELRALDSLYRGLLAGAASSHCPGIGATS